MRLEPGTARFPGNIFDFPVVYGQLEGALNSVNQCVITRKYAEAFFGSGVNPVGKH